MKLPDSLVLLPSRLINLYFDIYTGGRKRPVFFDIDETLPDLRKFEENFDTIQKELENIITHYRIPSYEEVDKYQYDAAKPKTKWKVFILNMMGEYPELSEKLCPETCKLIKNTPDIFQVIFSVLEPGRSIPAHRGPYKGYIRYHLGMKVPKENPPTIRIADQYYTWQENKSVLFDDSWDHEVFNQATEERIVLIVDIFRPMPKMPDRVNKFLTRYLIRPGYAKNAIRQYSKYFKKLDTEKQSAI